MNIPLYRSLSPGERESSFDSIIIFFERLCKATEFGDALLFHRMEPGIKAFPLPLSQHGRKCLNQEVGLSDLLIGFAQLGQMFLLPLQELLFLTGNPMSHL